MIVKTLKKTAALAMILSAATAANANEFGMKKFSAGIDVMGTTLDWKLNAGKDLFPKNPIGAGAFVATEFYNHGDINAGAEFGVEYMQKTNSNASVLTGQTQNNGKQASQQYNWYTKVKAVTPYLGLTGSYNINQQFKLIGMVGAGVLFGTVNQNLSSTVTGGVTILETSPKFTFKKTAMTPVARLGAQYNVNETFGVRANVSYRYAGGFKTTVTSATTGSVYNLQAKCNEFTYGAGVVFSF